MKRIVLTAGILVLAFAGALLAQTAGPKPGSEHAKLNVWIGDWTYEGESFITPLGPAGKFEGKMIGRSLLGGSFVELRGEEKDSSWFEVDGYDAVSKKFFWHGYNADGSVSVVTYNIDGPQVAYSGTGRAGEKQIKIRGTIVFAADFKSCVEKREISLDGQTWFPNFQNKFVKAR
jgi:hypothetical protein